MKIAIGKKELLRHILIWISIYIIFLLIDPVTGSPIAFIGGTLTILGNYAFTYYVLSLVIIPRLWIKYKVICVLSVLGYFAIFCAIDLSLLIYVLPIIGSTYEVPLEYLDSFINANLIVYIVFILQASGYFYNKYYLQKYKEVALHEKATARKERAAIQKEKELIKQMQILNTKELSFLKNQFSSHIMFNFLNFIYFHVHDQSQAAADAIENFSDMLRYTLELRPGQEIELGKEVKYIENFIALQKILSEKVDVDFNYQDMNPNKKIMPYILIAFVENAFKHGKINDSKNPIQINLETNNGHLNFRVKNEKSKPVTPSMSTGVGTSNVTQLLEIYYPGLYQLEVSEESNSYLSDLKINC